MSTKNPNPKTGRPQGLLEQFSISPETYDALRSDSYVKVLAEQSVDALESVFSLLLSPAALEKCQLDCPTWPKGHKYAGKLPSIPTLAEIKQLLTSEATLNGLGQISQFVSKLRQRASALPSGEQTEVLDSVITLVGEELLQAKLGGSSIAANLPVVDRLLMAASAKTKARQEEVKIGLRQQAEERQSKKLKLDVDRFQFDAAKAALAQAAKLQRISRDNKLTEPEKVNATRQLLFGILPK